jgi:AcrR family transcriptional regulator
MSITFTPVSKKAMGRPFTASDEDILQAARKVIARRGPEAFSITEVASDVGLSRAAIILRFKSTHALKVTLLARMVEEFSAALRELPQTPSGDNILRLAAFLGGCIHGRQRLARFFSSYNTNIQERDLLELELRRGEALRAAVSSVMPAVAIAHDAAVAAFSAHLTGTIMAWLGGGEGDARHYIVMRTREWLALVGIPCSESVCQEPAQPTRAQRASRRAAR